MKQPERNRKHARRSSATLVAALAAMLCLGLLAASPASAAYEQVANFAGTPGVLKPVAGDETEEVQLGGVGGMAVNYTGAGGVPAGTVYAARNATVPDPRTLVARYNPDGSFSERWSFEGNPEPKERCGPEGDPAFPTCTSQWQGNPGSADVDVDQSTGYVYVYTGNALPGENEIHVYGAGGAELIAEFGERAPAGQTVAEGPEKLHFSGPSVSGAIAVNGSGVVYVFDAAPDGNRLMIFEPQSPGDYEHYVYAGQSHDLATKGARPQYPVADAAGDLYAASEGGHFVKLDPSDPAAAALCEFDFKKAGVASITVNPLGGELFFDSEKDKGIIHELGGECHEGKFAEVGQIQFSPKRNELNGLAFDPLREYEVGRPPGVLYAGAPGGEGGKTEKGLSESSMGYIFSRPAAIPPAVEAESFAHVTQTTAELRAQINPKSSATRYAFQYETEAQYEENAPSERFAGAEEAPPGGAFLGEGTESISATGALVGLEPDTSYRFRAVATSHCSVEHPAEVCEATGTTLAFHTFPAEPPGLPDHRAYELVSPAEKGGGQVVPADPSLGTCDAITDCKPNTLYTHFPMQSAPDGEAIAYEGTAFDSEHASLIENEYLSRRDPKAGWQSANLTPTQMASKGNNGGSDIGGYWAFDPALGKDLLGQEGTKQILSPQVSVGYDDLYAQPTGDPAALTPLLSEAQLFHRSGGKFQMHYAGASEDLSRVFFEANDALTDETPFAPEAIDGGEGKYNLYEWHEGNLALVNVMPDNAETQPGAGFGLPSTHPISADGRRAFFSDESGQVYLREDGETTREISTEGTPDPGKFALAATDGSKVLLANGHLHYTEGAEETVDLTEGQGGFEGVVGESEDLSHVYFVDTAVLDEAPGAAGEEAVPGKNNLYAWAQGEGTRFVAQLGGGEEGANWSQPDKRAAEASPGGRYLAFLSKERLTGYDNTGPCRNLNPGWAPGPCAEAFLYDAATATLTCASCNPSGERPLDFTELRRILGGTRLAQPRYLTDEGRLYFDSRDSLVPADTNDGVEDVYQYEPQGVGTCTRAAGCTSLISAGTGADDSNFLTIDPSGKNVFFTTRDQLTLRDKDQLIDLYDAREGGGLAAETEVARTECQGEACQPPASAPNDPTPGSSTFEGAGNVKEEGKAKKHSKKHKKKRHAKKKKHAHKRAAKHNRGGAK